MRKVFELLVFTLILGLAPNPAVGMSAPERQAAPNEEAVLLFWADWCAPCQEELAQLPALKRAAGHVPIFIMVARAGRTVAALPRGVPFEQIRFVDMLNEETQRIFPGLARGLPFAVMRDHRGQICATHRGGLDEGKIRAWVAMCASGKR